MRVYCDTVIVVYLIEGIAPFKARALTRMNALWGAGDLAVYSDLSRMETRVQPIRAGDAVRLAHFDGYFARPDVEFVPITTAVFDRATHLRAAYNFKTADALHLAAAIESGCDLFLTNDLRLGACTDIPVERLP